ncbi:uncharacterized protein METZ01_LOCUS323520 [marine metagenome]|uniref:Uncharacterized protein n=1 Tax=marine metagenome TaxID=408172 RepID=A0A382PBR0_9ZZZZ
MNHLTGDGTVGVLVGLIKMEMANLMYLFAVLFIKKISLFYFLVVEL